jgi:hypothetical protein
MTLFSPRHLSGRDLAVVVDRSKGLVVRSIFREIGDVALCPVGVGNDDLELLDLALLEGGLGRLDRDAGGIGFVFEATRRALGDPLAEHFVELRIFLEAFLSFVRHRVDRFEEKQGMVGRRGKDPSSSRVVDDLAVIGAGIEGEDRKLEAILTIRLGMATPRHAAGTGEHRKDVVLEGDRGRTSGPKREPSGQ